MLIFRFGKRYLFGTRTNNDLYNFSINFRYHKILNFEITNFFEVKITLIK